MPKVVYDYKNTGLVRQFIHSITVRASGVKQQYIQQEKTDKKCICRKLSWQVQKRMSQ